MSSKDSLGSSEWSALGSLPAETAPTRASGFGVACFDMVSSDSKGTYTINICAEYNGNVTAIAGSPVCLASWNSGAEITGGRQLVPVFLSYQWLLCIAHASRRSDTPDYGSAALLRC